MAAEPKALDDMFHDMLKDVYYAEKQILKALPKMAKAARSPEPKKAFETHRASGGTILMKRGRANQSRSLKLKDRI